WGPARLRQSEPKFPGFAALLLCSQPGRREASVVVWGLCPSVRAACPAVDRNEPQPPPARILRKSPDKFKIGPSSASSLSAPVTLERQPRGSRPAVAASSPSAVPVP